MASTEEGKSDGLGSTLETLAAFSAGGIARTLISNKILPNRLKRLLKRDVYEILSESASLPELEGFFGS